MKKSELITKLQAIPGDPEVAILDHLQNINYDWGEGSSAGVHPQFDIELLGKDKIPEDQDPWIALSFTNPDYEDLEERTCRECGCTDRDCQQCIEKTGRPCSWVSDDLCSACALVSSLILPSRDF